MRRQPREPGKSNSAKPGPGQSVLWTLRSGGSWRSGLRPAAEVLQTQGAKTLLLRILAGTVYRTLIVTERTLEDPVTDVRPDLPVVTGLLKPSEVDQYVEYNPLADRSEISRRLDGGHLCFVARYQGRVIGSSWAYTDQSWWLRYLACELQFADDEAYLYHSYTSPEYRGLNVATARGAEEVRYLRDAGYRRMLALVLPWNKQALRSEEKRGWAILGLIGCVKLGQWRHHFCRVTRGSSPPVAYSAQPTSHPTSPLGT